MIFRALLSLMILPAFALVNDAGMDQLAGRRLCLDHGVASGSPELTDLLCFTVGVEGPDHGHDLRLLSTAWTSGP